MRYFNRLIFFVGLIFTIFRASAMIHDGSYKVILYNSEIRNVSLYKDSERVDNVDMDSKKNSIIISCDGIFLYNLKLDSKPFKTFEDTEVYNCRDMKTGEELTLLYQTQIIQNRRTVIIRVVHENVNEQFAGVEDD